ncbi:nitroreductase family protein [Lacticaseibacillus thailandensis]|uniref:Nitroreductase n=1 Tax=Lacticaseibacillus thailandensis DSM 22698 = JCM 13996 TaxID=1423810 RepID=A0A0R2C9D6_9LACO|nr:nitroreductase family protein [Lacticaseibacillus thailandensis]KRM86612.1 nitroreductase [Lacticaseibacillus thailandensis DSM 22698 = JCM 13996]
MLKIDDAALQHRSIRQFADVALTEEQLQTLEAVAQATATSKFMQQFSLIRVTDPQLQHAIAQVTTYQYVEGPGQLYIFVLDQARNVRLVQSAHGDLHQLTNWDALLGGVFDATLAAQNVVAAAERSGLGTVYLGSVLNDPQRMIDLLHLLRYTFPLLGLKVGVPAATPGLKPRWPRTAVVGINAYPQADTSVLRDYDNTIKKYYAARATNAKDNTYTQYMQHHLVDSLHHRDEIGTILRAQGFELPQ